MTKSVGGAPDFNPQQYQTDVQEKESVASASIQKITPEAFKSASPKKQKLFLQTLKAHKNAIKDIKNSISSEEKLQSTLRNQPLLSDEVKSLTTQQKKRRFEEKIDTLNEQSELLNVQIAKITTPKTGLFATIGRLFNKFKESIGLAKDSNTSWNEFTELRNKFIFTPIKINDL